LVPLKKEKDKKIHIKRRREVKGPRRRRNEERLRRESKMLYRELEYMRACSWCDDGRGNQK
jgi:hypothetical protein